MIDKDKLIEDLENMINNGVHGFNIFKEHKRMIRTINTILDNIKNGHYDFEKIDVDKMYEEYVKKHSEIGSD